MSWAENKKRLLIALIAFALVVAIGAVAGLASAGQGRTLLDAGAQPTNDEPMGELKIVKNLGGGWPTDAFIFTWDCDDGQSGAETFTSDFTGANRTVDASFPIGTVCHVTETSGSLNVGDYDVTTHIEGTAGFQAINGRDVPIDNSTGTNTIQFMNSVKPCEPYSNNCDVQ